MVRRSSRGWAKEDMESYLQVAQVPRKCLAVGIVKGIFTDDADENQQVKIWLQWTRYPEVVQGQARSKGELLGATKPTMLNQSWSAHAVLHARKSAAFPPSHPQTVWLGVAPHELARLKLLDRGHNVWVIHSLILWVLINMRKCAEFELSHDKQQHNSNYPMNIISISNVSIK